MQFADIVARAQAVHRAHHDPNAVQVSTLLSIKTGGCSEDCSYCSQSARYKTDTEREALMQVEEVVTAAKGQAVTRGEPLLILEAMKMEHTLTAPADGVVESVLYGVGDQVTEGVQLLAFKPAE